MTNLLAFMDTLPAWWYLLLMAGIFLAVCFADNDKDTKE